MKNNIQFKADYQLIARCTYDKVTGKAEYENFTHYYSKENA